MKKSLTLLLLAILSWDISVAQQQSNDAVKILKNAFGKSIKGYTIYSYPTDNYGVGTVCVVRWIPRGSMVCDMNDTYGLTSNKGNYEIWKTVNGYASYGTGNPVALTDTAVSTYGASLLLPYILKTLNVDFNGQKFSSNSVKVTIDSAIIRYLNFDKFKAYAESGIKPLLTQVYRERKAILVTSDVVLLKYKIELNTRDSIGLKIAAKLDSSLEVEKSRADSLGIKISKNENGTYVLASSRPVILGVMIKKQKKTGLLSTEDSFENWVEIKNDTIDPREFENKQLIATKK
jgi:hypothetical protein